MGSLDAGGGCASPGLLGKLQQTYLLGIMERYIEGSYKARLVFFFVALLWAGLVLFLQRFDTWFPISGTPQEQLVQSSDRALLAAIIVTVFYLTLSGIVVFETIWTVRTRQWPPHGMPFRTPIKEIKNPIMVWMFASSILAMYLGHIAIQVYAWYLTNELTQEAIRLLEPPEGKCTTIAVTVCSTLPHSSSF